jgi:integrase
VWLEEERELAEGSITLRISSARQFLAAQNSLGGVKKLKRLSVTDVEDFFISYGQTHGYGRTRSMQAAMRLFLRFATSRKWVRSELADAVPSMRSYQLSSVPRGLSDDDVRALVAASAEKSARDHAIVLLLALYGLRRGQVSDLQFEDIDWRGHTIHFRPHKGGKAVQHQLVPAVAAALSEYLQHERPLVNSQAVFLRQRKPYLPLGPSVVTDIVVGLVRRLGLDCTPCGPHALRHAFATRLLNDGQPLKVIADLLGHRSLAAVSIYAKVDHPRLLQVAAEWPEEAS